MEIIQQQRQRERKEKMEEAGKESESSFLIGSKMNWWDW